MANLDEIHEAIKVAKMSGCDQLGIFHCISSYPAPISSAMISNKSSSKRVNVQVGFLTTRSVYSRNCRYFRSIDYRKHFTLSRDEGVWIVHT